MKHFKTIASYCQSINISAPNQPFFDVRRFEDNMTTVVHQMEPFKHEFYAIAIKLEGTGHAISGHQTSFSDGATVFFNVPFQILSWDILPDWSGYYILISKEFIAQSKYLKNILTDFPYLKLDTSKPFSVAPKEVSQLLSIYESIHQENQQLRADSNAIIEAQVLVLLYIVKRYFNKQTNEQEVKTAFRKADIHLVSRFQSLLETSFYEYSTNRQTHKTAFYASRLAVHPNHLNATVKQVTGKTTKQHIHQHIFGLAQSALIQTGKSVKEIAYDLHFESPNHFSSFFKKRQGISPIAFRKNYLL